MENLHAAQIAKRAFLTGRPQSSLFRTRKLKEPLLSRILRSLGKKKKNVELFVACQEHGTQRCTLAFRVTSAHAQPTVDL